MSERKRPGTSSELNKALSRAVEATDLHAEHVIPGSGHSDLFGNRGETVSDLEIIAYAGMNALCNLFIYENAPGAESDFSNYMKTKPLPTKVPGVMLWLRKINDSVEMTYVMNNEAGGFGDSYRLSPRIAAENIQIM